MTSRAASQGDLDAIVASQVLQPKHFLEVVEERVSLGRCGFPLCREALQTSQSSPEKVKINYNQKAFHFAKEKSFCSGACEKAAGLFLRRLEAAAHFGAPARAPSSADEIIRALGVALDHEPLEPLPAPLPAFTNPALSSSGAVLAPPDVLRPTQTNEESAAKAIPKRIRQLKKKIIEDSSGPAVSQSVAELTAALGPPAPRDSSADAIAPFVSGAHITFAALNYTASSPSSCTSAKPFTNGSAPESEANRGHKKSTRVVSWSDDVKPPAPETAAKKPVAPEAAMKKSPGPLVGKVVEKQPEPLKPLRRSPEDAIEGYSPVVEKLPPRPAPASSADSSDTDDSASSEASGEIEVEEDYYTPLNLFSTLWLVSDDVFGSLLPLHTSYDGNRGEEVMATDADPAKTFPELCRGLANMEARLEVLRLPAESLVEYRFDQEFVMRCLLAPNTGSSSTVALTALEWDMMALLLIDGLLRRRGVLRYEAEVQRLLEELVQRCGRDISLTDREVFHLRSSFCPLT